MREVEEPGALADGPVLLEDPGVLEGHLPAAERSHPRAEREVHLVRDRRDRVLRRVGPDDPAGEHQVVAELDGVADRDAAQSKK